MEVQGGKIIKVVVIVQVLSRQDQPDGSSVESCKHNAKYNPGSIDVILSLQALKDKVVGLYYIIFLLFYLEYFVKSVLVVLAYHWPDVIRSQKNNEVSDSHCLYKI